MAQQRVVTSGMKTHTIAILENLTSASFTTKFEKIFVTAANALELPVFIFFVFSISKLSFN